MRTTLTLDSDVVALLREEMERARQPFKQVVNRALRLGLRTGTGADMAEPFHVEPWDSGGLRTGFDPDKLGQLDNELETQEFVRKYRRDQRRG